MTTKTIQNEETAIDELLGQQPVQPATGTETLKEKLEHLEREAEEVRQLMKKEEDAAYTAKVVQIATALKKCNIAIEDVQAYIDHNGRPKEWPSKQKGATATTSKKAKSALPPLYRDPVSGKTWTGRGVQPGWFKAARVAGTEDMLKIQNS